MLLVTINPMKHSDVEDIIAQLEKKTLLIVFTQNNRNMILLQHFSVLKKLRCRIVTG